MHLSTASLGRLALGAVLIVSVLGAPPAAQADVSRIREKALELEQNLNKQAYRYLARGEKSNTERVYKDFEFILSKSKVDEVAAETGDPYANRLRQYLIESIVGLQIASFEDEQRAYKQTATADLDGQPLAYAELLKRLATAEDPAARRKIYSAMDPLFETISVFGNEIIKRREKQYQPWGYANFAAFYAERENLDLEALSTTAGEFLQSTQALYDELLEYNTQTFMGMESRKLRFYDLPYLLQGNWWEPSFPIKDRSKRVNSVFQGLGIQIPAGLVMDERNREGKALATGVFPELVPTTVNVSINPVGGVADDDNSVFAAGQGLIFALSTQTRFEPAYLPNRGVQAALAYVPMLALFEPAWFDGAANQDSYDGASYRKYRAFQLLAEARRLAAKTQLEILAYGGDHDLKELQRQFRELMGTATGARISSSDSARNSELYTQLESASRFQGLLLAAGIRESLVAAHGAEWWNGGKVGASLNPLWQSGGSLNVDKLTTTFAEATGDAAAMVRLVESLAAAE